MLAFPKDFRCQRGQTLMELLLGVAILTLVLLAALALTTRSVQDSEVGAYRQQATLHAKEGIEQVRRDRNMLPWSQFAQNGVQTSTIPDEIPFQKRVEIMPDPNDPTNYLKKKVQVTISWSDVKGTHQVVQETLLTNWR